MRKIPMTWYQKFYFWTGFTMVTAAFLAVSPFVYEQWVPSIDYAIIRWLIRVGYPVLWWVWIDILRVKARLKIMPKL